jgi:hypothetical protein
MFPSVFLKTNWRAVGARFNPICVIRGIPGSFFGFFASLFVPSTVQILRDCSQGPIWKHEPKESQDNFNKRMLDTVPHSWVKRAFH